LQEFTGAPNGQAREDLRRNSLLGGPRCFREVQELQEFRWIRFSRVKPPQRFSR
jgi:hypothetical protein